MAKKKTRLEELKDYAKGVGLQVHTWSPGDGQTRYRFFDQPGPGQTYFGPASGTASGTATVLGLKKAWDYLYSYGADRSSSHAQKRSVHATRSDRAAQLLASYRPWTQSYSNEDQDRYSSLASALTQIDREEGNDAPPVGYSKQRYAEAKQAVNDANNYGARVQQSYRSAKGLLATRAQRNTRHARKKKLTAHEAKRLLESEGIDFSKDYFGSIRMSDGNRIAEVAKMAGYKKSKNAPGSTGRMYFQYLSRLK